MRYRPFMPFCASIRIERLDEVFLSSSRITTTGNFRSNFRLLLTSYTYIAPKNGHRVEELSLQLSPKG
jgi:hypothetical protein